MSRASHVIAGILIAAALGCSSNAPPGSGFARTHAAAGTSHPGAHDPGAPTPATDPAGAKAAIAAGAVVLDVRSPEEYESGHVASATNVASAEVPDRIAEIDALVGGDRSKPVVVYCGSGRRAAKAKDALDAAGYTHVINGGGISDLQP